jgi:RHS repeat-associated protein
VRTVDNGGRWGVRRLAAVGCALTLLAGLANATGVSSTSPSPSAAPRPGTSLLKSPTLAASAGHTVAPAGQYVAGRSRPAKQPTPVQEIVADRTATTSTWRDSDGSLSVRHYLTPQFFETAAGTWSPIDSNLSPVAAEPGWWQSGANSWSVAFGPAGSQDGAVRFTAGGHTFGFAPQGIGDAQLAPSVSGDSATYDNAWPHVDLAEHVSADEVKEDLVVKGPGAPSSFSFRLSGATAVPNQAGGADVVADGAQLGSLPAPTVSIASAKPSKSSLDQTSASKVRMTVADGVVQVSVSPDWLAKLPASAFPVTIDPTFGTLAPATGWQVSSVSDGGQVLNGVMQVGQDTAGANWRPEAYIPAPTAPTVAPGDQPWQFTMVWWMMSSDSQLTDEQLFGLAGNSTFSQIPAGQLLATAAGPTSGVGLTTFPGAPGWPYISSQSNGWWFGWGTPSAVAGPNGGTLATIDPSSAYFMVVYGQQPNPTSIASPVDGSVVSTTTPTLTTAVLPTPASGCQVSGTSSICADSSDVYDFKVSTSPDGTGTVIDSGWLSANNANPTAPITWSVPPGSLHDGVTYYAEVLTSLEPIYAGDPGYSGNLKPSSSAPIRFVVKERLGNGGPSPTDTIGNPPAGTTTPAQGAPSPGVPTASETVNLLTGNLNVSLGTPSMQTVSGSAGLALSYNSAQSSIAQGGNYGLTGQYYPDSGAHTFTGALAGQRTDADVDASWNEPPVGGLQTSSTATGTPYLVRWTGALSLPAGTWQLGGATTGGMRVILNGATTPAYDDWAGTAGDASPSYGTATVNGAQQYQIEVDSWVLGRSGTTDSVQLWAQNTAAASGSASQFVVPSSWLTPVATGVPAGWSLVANPASAQWIHADDEGDQVVLQAASGDTDSFTREAAGYYQSQPGDNDLLSVNGNGQLQLATSDNELYTFNPDGSLASMTSATDDLHPAALQYTYSGTPALLRAITDPVSARAITLSYGGDAACPTANPAPAGMLCQVSFWDGTTTTFGYNGNGQIASVTDPMGYSDLLAYDSDNRLADIRDALAGNYVAAGGQAGTPVACATGTTGLSVAPVDTQICYDSSGRVATVTQPAPTPGAARPSRSYTYGSGYTDTAIAGFQPTSGYESKTSYDAQGRIIGQTDSSGHTTTTVWANATAPGNSCTDTCGDDQAVVTATPDGEQTSTMYDVNGNVTDTYGPAPLACFSGGWPTGVTPTAPVQGYLPVSNPQSTTGCGVATIPHTRNGYDEGMTGLAASFWSNGQAAGPVTMHADGPGGTQPQSLCGATSGQLCAHWDAGSPPVASDASGQWSLRLTGTIDIATAGTYMVAVASSQAITVAVDGVPQVHDGAGVSGFTAGQTGGVLGNATQFNAGVHAIQVDFQGSATQLNEFAVALLTSSGGGGVISDSVLDPGYQLQTSTTDPDGVETTTSYSDGTVGPQYELATSSTVGAGSSTALTTSTTYEAPSASTYLRKTSRTLAAGNATTYTYYTGTQGPVAAVCGIAADTPQGGQVLSQTDPAPGAGAPAREQQFIYTAAGRTAGQRVGSPADIDSQPWQCTTYDADGRTTSQSWPAFNGAPARTITYTYSVGGNPLVSSVSDASGTITSTVDLLGRETSYTDSTGQTSTTAYNQAGQPTATTGPGGAISTTYDPNSGNLATVTDGSTLLATTQYDANTGRLTSVTYGNGTTGTVGYDGLDNENSLVFTNTAGGALVAGDQTTLSPAKRVTSELDDINGALTNPNPAGATSTTYTYDGAGRLVTAYLPGESASYGYGANPAADNCANPGEGANTNRTNVTITPTGGTASSTDYCYNSADQLVSSTTSAGTGSQYAYDEHGNQTEDNGTALTWDAANRLASSTTSGGSTTSYSYDALDRVVSHTAGGTTVRYAYSGFDDSAVATLDGSGNVLQQLVPLPGGVLATVQTSGTVWSYPDLHGNVTVTTDNSGKPLNGPVAYDPWGQPLSGSPTIANTAGGNVLGAFGSKGKLTDTATGITIMGARAYVAAEGRFLSVDPIEGGCANNYVYVNGDPFSKNDLTGRFSCPVITIPHLNLNDAHVGQEAGALFGGYTVWWSKSMITTAGGSGAGWKSGGIGAAAAYITEAYVTNGRVDTCSLGELITVGVIVGLFF